MPDDSTDREAESLARIIAPARWQRVQDHIAEVLAVGLRTLNPDGSLAVNPSWPSGLDAERLTTLFKLGEELEDLLPPHALPTEFVTISRPFGISFSALPLKATQRIVAYCVVGPLIVGRRQDPALFRQSLAEYGLEAQVVEPALLTIKTYSFSGLRAVGRFLEEVGTLMLQLAQQARSLLRVEAGALDRLLHALLETATMATEAEGGSVMVYDAQQQALQIKTAKGLSEEIVEKTSVPLGEGLAGLAALRQAILLLDDRTEDQSVKQRMQREDVVSAVVAPIIPEAAQEPIGVLNLRTSNPQRQFTDKDIELLKRLLELASVALTSLRAGLSASS